MVPLASVMKDAPRERRKHTSWVDINTWKFKSLGLDEVSSIQSIKNKARKISDYQQAKMFFSAPFQVHP